MKTRIVYGIGWYKGEPHHEDLFDQSWDITRTEAERIAKRDSKSDEYAYMKVYKSEVEVYEDGNWGDRTDIWEDTYKQGRKVDHWEW